MHEPCCVGPHLHLLLLFPGLQLLQVTSFTCTWTETAFWCPQANIFTVAELRADTSACICPVESYARVLLFLAHSVAWAECSECSTWGQLTGNTGQCCSRYIVVTLSSGSKEWLSAVRTCRCCVCAQKCRVPSYIALIYGVFACNKYFSAVCVCLQLHTVVIALGTCWLLPGVWGISDGWFRGHCSVMK